MTVNKESSSVDSKPKSASFPVAQSQCNSLKNTQYLSLLSGFYACLASVVGKLSTDPRSLNILLKLCSATAKFLDTEKITCNRSYLESFSVLIRLFFFVLMFVVNGLMWTTYTKALNASSNSIRVTVLNNASNMTATAFFGYFLFGEVNNLLWWLGASFVISGTVLLNSQASPKEKTN